MDLAGCPRYSTKIGGGCDSGAKKLKGILNMLIARQLALSQCILNVHFLESMNHQYLACPSLTTVDMNEAVMATAYTCNRTHHRA